MILQNSWQRGSFVNLEALFSDYVIVDDSFRDFYNVRGEIYDRYLWNYQNAVYGAIRSILRDYENCCCDKSEGKRQSKRMYEALRLKNLYGQLMNESEVQLNSRPEFYIADLSERCFIGNVKSGVLDSVQFFDKAKDIEPPAKDEPNPPDWFNVISFANGVVKKYILYRDFDQNCDKTKA